MAKQVIKAGFTDYTTLVFIPDPASTDGSGKTGLVAANLTVSGVRVETDNDVTVTDYTASLNDLAALTTVHTDWGLKEVSSTLAPGLYRLDIADAIFASGAWSAVVYVMITTSAAAASPMEFTLVAYDINDTVRMGLTALPNAAADAAGGLIISDAGGLDADAQRADVAAILVDTGTTLDARIPAALVGGRMDASVGAMASGTLTAAALATDAVDEIVDGVWDEPLSAATHNVGSSAGKRLRQITAEIADSGTAQAGTATTITLAATASSTDGIYDPGIVRISEGTGSGQSRVIIEYIGSTRVASVDRDWRVTPDSTSVYEVVYSPNMISTNEGLAQGGTASTITLNSTADSNNDTYVGQIVVLRTGTGQDQSRVVSAYNGTTKVATVSPNWITNPAAGSGYIMWPIGWARVGGMEANVITAAATAADFTTEVTTGLAQEATVAAIKAVTDALPNAGALTAIQSDLDNIQTRIPAALTAGGNMKSDALAISGSATAADNLEGGGLGLVVSTCAAGSTTTSIVTNLTEATDDHYNGRVITFTTGALLGQTTSISDYVGATKTLTVVALTEAPADTDGFVIS